MALKVQQRQDLRLALFPQMVPKTLGAVSITFSGRPFPSAALHCTLLSLKALGRRRERRR